MPKRIYYLPLNPTKKMPVMVGLPGIVTEDEPSKDTVLEELSNHRIAGIRMNYPNIVRSEDGKTITCKFNLDSFLKAISDTFKHIIKTPEYDQTRIGILASSISAGIFGHYLTRINEKSRFKVQVSISPFTAWTDYGTKEDRVSIEKNRQDIDIRLGRDREKGISRIIPHSYLGQVKRFDSIGALELTITAPKPAAVLTLAGKEDQISKKESMTRYHQLVSGPTQKMLWFENEGHELPYKKTEPIIIDWIKKHI